MNQTMTFPETIEEFIERHKFKDSEEVYTNGSELIQVYRIKQWIDAHPVKHGRWVRSEYDDAVHCSECWDEYVDDGLELNSWVEKYFKFCPHCGAKMDEVEQDETD